MPRVREVSVIGRPRPGMGRGRRRLSSSAKPTRERARCALPRRHRPLQAAEGLRVRRRAAEEQLRQDPQDRAARARSAATQAVTWPIGSRARWRSSSAPVRSGRAGATARRPRSRSRARARACSAPTSIRPPPRKPQRSSRAKAGTRLRIGADASKPPTSRRWSRPARRPTAASTCSTTMSASPSSAAWSRCRRPPGTRSSPSISRAPFSTMKHVIPLMARQGGGSIINISSIASIRYHRRALRHLHATKAALNHLTRTTAVEYAEKRVRVNAILPGLMKTPMVEKSAGLAQSYAAGDVEEMWRVRDRQVPMGSGGSAWDVAWAAVLSRQRREPLRHRHRTRGRRRPHAQIRLRRGCIVNHASV